MITKFDGTYMDWPRFWGQFTEAIDKTSVQPITKFSYLRELLHCKVKRTLEALPFMAEGYNRAKSILNERFGKESETVKAYIKEILDLPSISSANPRKVSEFSEKLTYCVQALQTLNKSVILNADTKANSVQLFRQLDWVPFYHEANVSRLSMVYKRLSGDCPSYLSHILIRNADINERSSRHGLLNLVCARLKRQSEGGRSFTVSTTRLWNMIPSNIRNKPSLVSFKKAMFDYFKDTHKHLDHFTI